MPNKEEIAAQQELLTQYRFNLAHLLKQAANHGGEQWVPVDLANGIRTARKNVQRVKSILQNWRVSVGDHPDDDPDATTPAPQPATTYANIFISYKRNVVPDERLALQLRSALQQAGHNVFIDQSIMIGVDWPHELQRQIQASDYVVILLSPTSSESEMVAREVAFAHQHCQRTGKARLLPVRVNYSGPVSYQLSHYLDRLQYASWNGEADTHVLIEQLLAAVAQQSSLPLSTSKASPLLVDGWFGAAPKPYADPRFIESLRNPQGTDSLRSEFYIERDGDVRLRRELHRMLGTTTAIRAPRQSGKSSLLIRGIAQAQQNGSKAVLIDMQSVEEHYLSSLDIFLRYIITVIVSKLRLDVAEVEQAWHSVLGASDKATYLLEDYILPQVNTKLVLALDEADRLLGTSFQDSFFGLLRFWHNNRAMNELWERLDIVMVISTEPYLLIRDVSQSPFNVAVSIRLEDFNQQQVWELNRRYHSPLDDARIPALMDFLNGHPYLTRRALYTLVTEHITWEQLTRIATSEQSPFGDHLRRYIWLLRDQDGLRDSLKHIIQRNRCPDEMTFYRLLRSGLIVGADHKSCRMRCWLYEEYLRDRL